MLFLLTDSNILDRLFRTFYWISYQAIREMLANIWLVLEMVIIWNFRHNMHLDVG